MLLAVVVLTLMVQTQPPTCADAASCRQAAIEAMQQKDYEAFHDLAWLAFRKGKADDPELMLLLARAQSLSGRPGDAIVMLERLAARGIITEVETSDDFAAVRRHPRWKGATSPADAPTAASESSAATRIAKPDEPKPTPPDSPSPAKAPKKEAAKPPAIDPAPVTRNAKPDVPAPTPKPEPAKAPAPKKDGVAFTTLLSPSALAYDAVSKRYLIADRQARRIAVVDENTGTVSTLVGERARLGEIHGMAIDPRQGDLWVVTSSADGPSLSRLQLISGRELAVAAIRGVRGAIGGVAFVRGAGLIVSDQFGDVYKVSAAGQAEKIGGLEYVPTALGADGDGILYVTAGGARIARFSVVPFRRLGVVELDAAPPKDLPFTVVRDTIHLVVAVDGGYEVRVLKK